MDIAIHEQAKLNSSLQMQIPLQKGSLLGFKYENSNATPSLQPQTHRSPSQLPTTPNSAPFRLLPARERTVESHRQINMVQSLQQGHRHRAADLSPFTNDCPVNTSFVPTSKQRLKDPGFSLETAVN